MKSIFGQTDSYYFFFSAAGGAAVITQNEMWVIWPLMAVGLFWLPALEEHKNKNTKNNIDLGVNT